MGADRVGTNPQQQQQQEHPTNLYVVQPPSSGVNEQSKDETTQQQQQRQHTPLKIDNRYILGRKINQGAFGKVYKVYDTFNKNIEYAAKFEIKKPNQSQTINNDYYIMKALKRSDKSCMVPSIQYFGQISNSLVLIMDLMGPSLEDLFTLMGKKFSDKTIVLLSLRMLRAIDTIHTYDIIHRDIKPDNFVMGGNPKNSHKIYLIDFGLSKRVNRSNNYDTRTLNTRAKNNAKKHSLTGTVRYVSTNIHDGHDASKWDDLMSLGYVMVYLSKGILPWMGLRADDTAHKYEKICNKKKSVPLPDLCEGIPRAIQEFLEIVKSKLVHAPYCFLSEPDYVNYYLMFRACAASMDIKLDFVYDWSDKNFDAMSILSKKSKAAAEKQAQQQQQQQNDATNQNQQKLKPVVQVVQSNNAIENPFNQKNNSNLNASNIAMMSPMALNPDSRNDKKFTIMQNNSSNRVSHPNRTHNDDIQ